jgi:hypothetical protein
MPSAAVGPARALKISLVVSTPLFKEPASSVKTVSGAS